MSGSGRPSRPVKPARERAQRALAHDRDAPLLEHGHRVREHVVVEALAADVVVGQAHPEPCVHLVQVPAGDVDQPLPDGQRVRVPGLQPDQPAPGPLGERRVVVELAPGRLVERVRVGGQQGRLGRILAHVEQVLDQHAERGAPVADVVVPDHPVPGELQDAGDGVADDGGAQVPDVHFLGHVRRGVLHHHRLRGRDRRQPEPGVAEHPRGLGGDPVVAQREVDEPGPADLGLGAHVRHVQPGGQLGGHLTGRAPQPLAERQRHVGLEVRERGRPDQRVGVAEVRAERRDDGVVYPLRENLLWIGHTSSL